MKNLMMCFVLAMIMICVGCSGVNLNQARQIELNEQIHANEKALLDTALTPEKATENMVRIAAYFTDVNEAGLFEGVRLNADWSDWIFKVSTIANLDAADANAGNLTVEKVKGKIAKYNKAMKVLRAAHAGQPPP